ncbi:hypothetical protein SVIOM342S_10061 [Streptomyces violaceorubidus]
MVGQCLERPEPQFGQLPHLVLVEDWAGQDQVADSSGPRGPSLVRALSSSGWASATRGSVPPTPDAVASTVQSGTVSTARVLDTRGGEPAEVVEGDLRCRQPGEAGRRVRVEMAYEPVPDALLGHLTQLLLDALDDGAGSRSARERVGEVGRPRVHPHGMQAGEPAHRAGQVRAADQFLLAPVSLQVQKHPGSPAAPATGPGERERRQQDVVHLGPDTAGTRVSNRSVTAAGRVRVR